MSTAFNLVACKKCGYAVPVGIAHICHGALPFADPTPVPTPFTEADIRRIVREEIAKAHAERLAAQLGDKP